MLKRYHRIVGGVFRVVDACVIGGVWLLAYWLRFNVPLIEVTKGFPAFSTYAALLPLVMGLWMIVFSSMRVYQSRRMLRRTHEAHLILKAHGVALLFFIALTYLFSEYKYSRGVILYFGVMGAIGLVYFRVTLRNALRTMRSKGYNLRHVLIIGEGGSVESVQHRLHQFPEMGLRVKGAAVHPNSTTTELNGAPVLGKFSDVAQLIRKEEIDVVVIALPRSQYAELDHLLEQIQDETVDIRLIPDIHEYVTLGCEVEEFDGFPIVNLNDSPLDGWGSVSKRITDIFFSILALMAFLPIMALISFLIKCFSRGPIFYAQERMGLDGHPFKMYKFRTMRVDAEEQSGAVWASENDHRKTQIGSFLRSTSLDELPQFWNVLKGDMSLVGPRPERPVFVKKFKTEIPHYMLRHKVKSGITGWAQVNGWRGNTSLDRRIEFDLYYIRNWSYFMDLKILALTPFKGFVNRNAY